MVLKQYLIYFWENASRVRERGIAYLKWAWCLQQWAQCRAWTHELRDHDLSQSWMANQLSHQDAPIFFTYSVILVSDVQYTDSAIPYDTQYSWQQVHSLIPNTYFTHYICTPPQLVTSMLLSISKCMFLDLSITLFPQHLIICLVS